MAGWDTISVEIAEFRPVLRKRLDLPPL